MLQKIRDKITGVIAIVFLAVIAVVFVFWGVDFQSTTGNFAARVDGERISLETVRNAWQQRQSQLQQMMRGELPEELMKAQQNALLDQFVRQSVLTQRAQDLGYRVSDEALARRVMEFPQFQVDGKFSQDRYAALLRQSGLTEAQFESDLQTELLVTQLQNGVIDSAFVATHELDRRFALEKQQRDVDYALIAASDFAAGVTVTDEQIQAWYDERKLEYSTPETVDLQYVELTRAKAEGSVTVSEAALKEYYEQIKERYQTAERRRGRHILIPVADGVDDAAARKQAEDLTAKAKAGSDFAQLAKENSKDPGSAEQGGDLGWAERGMFVGPFEDALFSMSAGEIRGPIKTQFGYHVLRLEESEAGHLRSFEEARAELEAEYRAEKSQTIFYDESQKLADESFSSLTELGSVAKALDLPVKTINDFTREGGGELGEDPSMIEAAFSEEVLARGQNSPLITIGEDRALVLRVANHKPAEPKPLAEVRAQIAARLRTQAAQEAAAKQGAEALARLQQGESWDTVTVAMGLKPVGKRAVTREDSVVPPPVLRTAFSVPPAQVADKRHSAGTVTDDGNYAVLTVTEVRNGDPATEPAEEKLSRRRVAERQLGNEEFAAYIAEAERNVDVVKNPTVFD